MTSKPLWSVQELEAATGGKLINAAADVLISSVSIDSRSLEAGALFFAITGVSMDGHRFVPAAQQAGAALCVVCHDKLNELPSNQPYLAVADTFQAMRDVGAAGRARMQGKVIGVTGSVGKTSAKEMLRHALTPNGKTHAPDKSFNNHWGVPLTAARMPRDCDYGVFEMGMSAPNEITPLTTLVKPHIAMITTVAPVHLEFFDNVEGIADAKAEIFDGLDEDGIAILNRDNAHYERLLARAKLKTSEIYSFGVHEKADAKLLDIEVEATGSLIKAKILDEEVSLKLAIPGAHQAMNALAVLLAVKLSGANMELALEGLAAMAATEGRGAQQVLTDLDGRSITLIDESYNANPASMRAALAVLKGTAPSNGGRRIAVLGDMLELGVEGAALHAELSEVVGQSAVDLVFACGPLMKNMFEALPSNLQAGYAETAKDLGAQIIPQLKTGDVVMVKGSNGVRMKCVLQDLRDAFMSNA
jgi:UDP-N-acetylmuramoyl-tripeptide--D-alanyl-D-alanine ligase